ncbi:MAG: phage tail tape measure protein, partial [Gemmiger sp.]
MATADFHIIGDTKLDGSGFQKGLGKLGNLAAKGLAVVSGALAGMGAYAIKVGSEFESGMSEVAAISGATGDDLTRLADKAKEMGAATKFSATESAEALKYMAMAGWDTENMLAGLPGVMNLAAASGESLAAVSDIVTDAMTAFGETIDEGSITHFADVLAATSSSANTNVGLMGETFKYVAPLAGALGYSINDTAQAIGLMANAGIKGGQAGTALRAILSRLTNPTNEVTSAMAALGLSMTDASGEALPLGMLMENLRQAFAGLSEAEKTQMAAALGGQEAMSGLLAVVNASEEDYAKLADAIADSDGAASAMAATMNDNLQGSITILKSALEGLGIQFYESIDAPLREIAQAATTYVGILSDAFVSGGLTALVQALGSVLADAATQLVQTAPQLVSAAVSVVDALVAGLAANAPQLLDAATALGAALLQGLAGLLPTVGSFAASLFAALYPRLMEGVPRLTELGIDWLGALG